MRILLLSQLIPYPFDAGPKVRIYHVLQHLAAANHDITLLAFRRESDTPDNIEHLRQYCTAVHTIPMPRSRLRDAWHLGRSLLLNQPFLIARDSVAAMHRKVKELITSQTFDAIHADQLWTAQYALAAKVASGRGAGGQGSRGAESGLLVSQSPTPHSPLPTHHSPLLILDQHNATYLIPQRLAEGETNLLQKILLRREAKVMRRYELDVCHQFDHVVWVTAEDRAAVLNNSQSNLRLPTIDNSQLTIHNSQFPVIPICIDPDTKPMIKRVPTPHRVTFLGGLHWPPNAAGVRWFAREVWPHVLEQCPTAVLTIIGKNPPDAIRNPQSSIPQESPIRNLEITGYVDDPTPYLQETAVFIVPLHAGGGMRVKILDAWAWGLPIVSTTIGTEGISYRHEENVLIADEPEPFAATVIRLLRNLELGDSLARAGRQTVEQCYDWRNTYQAWTNVYYAHKSALDRRDR